jgi:hypothetical protein
MPVIEAGPRAETAAGIRPDAPGERDSREPLTEWPHLIRALTATDEDDLPLFGRFPA